MSDLDLFERNFQKVINIMLNTDPNDSLDFEDLIARSTVDISSEFLFGENLDTLSYRKDGFHSFTNAFMGIQALIRRRVTIGDLWPVLELFKDGSEEYKRTIRSWVDPLVVRAVRIQKEMQEKGQTVNPDDCTFLEYLATTTQGIYSPFMVLLTNLVDDVDARHGCHPRPAAKSPLGCSRYGEC